MSLVLYPLAAPSRQVRVWAGFFRAGQTPTEMKWKLNGAQVTPTCLKPISSARPDELVDPNEPRVFSGVYEFTDLNPSTTYEVSLVTDDRSASLTSRTLPDRLPEGFADSFNVLLVSCFHQAEDRGGLAGTIVSQLKGPSKPHLSLLMGDQVYLDLPTLKNFKNDTSWLAKKFEQDYVSNWEQPPGYAGVLAAAPSVSLPDDHEYWNNFPHASPFIQNTWTANSRQHWREAADAMYRGFQSPTGRLGESFTLDVEPLSFFFADARTQRDENRRATMTAAMLNDLKQWVADSIRRQRIGVFVTGQSLFEDAKGRLHGKVADYAMADYGDYGDVMRTLATLPEHGRPLLCLTGDVHWGRVVAARDIRSQRIAIHEIISSPASLVTTVGVDTVKRVGSWIGGIFGSHDPWPRHADAEKPPAFLACNILQKTFECDMIHPQKGNHVSLVSFRRDGAGVALRIVYWPIDPYGQDTQPVQLPEIKIPGSLT